MVGAITIVTADVAATAADRSASLAYCFRLLLMLCGREGGHLYSMFALLLPLHPLPCPDSPCTSYQTQVVVFIDFTTISGVGQSSTGILAMLTFTTASEVSAPSSQKKAKSCVIPSYGNISISVSGAKERSVRPPPLSSRGLILTLPSDGSAETAVTLAYCSGRKVTKASISFESANTTMVFRRLTILLQSLRHILD